LSAKGELNVRIFNTRFISISRYLELECMIRRNRSVLAKLLVLIIIVTYASVVRSSVLSLAQNSDDISDNDSVRGSLLIVQEGIAYRTPEEAHNMKLEIMTEYFLNHDNDEIVVDNGLALGHLSLDDIEGIYFLKFSMLKILKISRVHHYCVSR
jgi:hypothetical protein